MRRLAASVGILAARHPDAGSYFVYIGRSLGPYAGALAGWAMISAYIFTGVAVAAYRDVKLSSRAGFLGYMAIGGVWFALLKARSPQILSSIQHDLEG